MLKGQALSLPLLLLFVFACGDDPAEPGPEPFAAMVISDTHVLTKKGMDAERIRTLVEQLNAGKHPSVKLLLLSGDNVDTLWDKYDAADPSKGDLRLANFMDALSGLKPAVARAYPVPGNHDYKYDDNKKAETEAEVLELEKLWRKTTGHEPYFSVEYRGFLFIALNNFRGRRMGAKHYFDDKQMSWFDKELKRGLPTVVYFHYPIKTDHERLWTLDKSNIVPRSQTGFYNVAAKYKEQIKAIFVGHGHIWIKDTLFSTIPVYETSSFGKTMPAVDKYHLASCDPATGEVKVTKGTSAPYFE